MAARPPRDCPCHSGERYAACCAPYHRGDTGAPTPDRLMRSRYAAFALGLGEYLVGTLAQDHPDRKLPRELLVRTLSRMRDNQRFLGLTLLHTSAEGDAGEVLFHARIFERGQDRSFAELSSFRREDGAWRYADGVVVAGARLPKELASLDRETFLGLADAAKENPA